MGKGNARIEYGDVLTMDEACQYLQVSRPWLAREVASGRLPGLRIGRRWRFSRAMLLGVIEGRVLVDTSPAPVSPDRDGDAE